MNKCGRKALERIEIRSGVLKETIKKKGLTIYDVAEDPRVNRKHSTLYKYINDGEIPVCLLNNICEVLEILPILIIKPTKVQKMGVLKANKILDGVYSIQKTKGGVTTKYKWVLKQSWCEIGNIVRLCPECSDTRIVPMAYATDNFCPKCGKSMKEEVK